jgi:uncharacterized protein (DUF302 family)
MANEAATGIGYGYGKYVDLAFEAAVQRAREELASEGFGVLCEIDVKKKLKEKLGVDFTNYIILGACNPPLAHQALLHEPNLGLLLPCNVVVYEKEGRSFVAAIDAFKMLSVVENASLEKIAGQVNEKLQKVIDRM